MSLVLNIAADEVSSYFVSHTSDEISIAPKLSSPKLFPKIREFLECLSSRNTFHYLNYIGWGVFGRRFGEYVHVIFHYLHCIYIKAILFCNTLKYFFKVSGYFLVEYLFTVFGYPDQVVFKIIDGVFDPSYSHAVFYNRWNLHYQDLTRLSASHFHPVSKLAGIQWIFL